jgi:hypothetical protein
MLASPKNIALMSLTVLLLSSCGLFHTITGGDVVGEYVYKYKSGEIEVWLLRPDFTYQQEFYKTVEDYQKRSKVEYTNSGTWSLSTNKVTLINNQITLFNTLDFFDYTNLDRALAKPLHVVSQPSDWYAPSGQDGARIAISLDIDYVLFRTSNRNLVLDNGTNP